MTIDDVKEQLLLKLRGLKDLFEDEELDQAITDALGELGLSDPPSTNKASYWFLRRCYRNCIEMMMTESAHKFKYKQINLQNRFEHYIRILKREDEAWKEVEADVLLEVSGLGNSSGFGSYLGSGLHYSPTGKQILFQKTPTSDIFPNEEDV